MVYGGVRDVSACGYLRVFDHPDFCVIIFGYFYVGCLGWSLEKPDLLSISNGGRLWTHAVSGYGWF